MAILKRINRRVQTERVKVCRENQKKKKIKREQVEA